MNQRFVINGWGKYLQNVTISQEMATGLAAALRLKGVPVGIMQQLFQLADRNPELSQKIFGDMAQKFVDEMPPLVTEIVVPTPKFNPIDRLAPPLNKNRWSVRDPINLERLIQSGTNPPGDVGKTKTKFCVVQFWKGWSRYATLLNAGRMGLCPPSIREIMCFADYCVNRMNSNPIPPGYTLNSLVSPWLYEEKAELPYLLGIAYDEDFIITEVPIGNFRDEIPTERSEEIDGFGVTFPFLFVKS